MAEDALCSTRIIENFMGKMINEATFSSPIALVGWSKMPSIGKEFKSFSKKSEAEEYAKNYIFMSRSNLGNSKRFDLNSEIEKKIIPLVLKADVWGSIEAIEKEIDKIKEKIEAKNAEFRIVGKGVGPISENDVKSISGGTNAIVLAFHVKADQSAKELAESRGISIAFFDVIYKMTEWLEEEMEKRRPRIETIETTGRAKILKVFSRTKEKQIVGGKVTEGELVLNGTVKIIRRDFEIGRGKIVNLETGKVKTREVLEGAEFGMMIESKMEIVAGDVIELFSIEQK